MNIRACDLFCGAGGSTTGLLLAAADLGMEVDMVAINHWDVAIETHLANHPQVKHLCESLDSVDPQKLFPGGLDVLIASPECTHFSRARGRRPKCDQSRASAWHVARWAEVASPERILIENVREWEDWGPLDASGRPIPSKKGVLYQQFLGVLRTLGYGVSSRLLNAADYGDPTTRRRLFVQARKSRRPVDSWWPEPTHGSSQPKLFPSRPWRAAKEIIDFSLPSRSIFGRKRPLKPNTLRRIEAGLRKFSGMPFIVVFRNNQDASSIESPLSTLTTLGANFGVCQPFIVQYNTEGAGDSPRALSVDGPLGTVTTANRFGLVQPFLVKYNSTGSAYSVQEPLDTVTSRDRFGLVVPKPQSNTSGGEAWLDIHFRMLQPQELAAAMSFPTGYRFAGTRADRVCQIGNAVPCRLSRALCSAILRDYALAAG